MARWYFQHFTGEEFFQHSFPHERSDLSHWRKRLGDKLELLLAESLRVAHASGALRTRDLARVTVDTTVQPKAISFPTDAKLLHAAIQGLNRMAKKHGVRLRQSYSRIAKHAAMMAGRYAHASLQSAYERILKESQRPRARCRLHWRQHQLSTNITGRPLNEGRSVSRKGQLLGQLVIVSNRVAIPERSTKARAGGLEVAVRAALKHKSGIWLGWSGKVATQTKIATQRVVHDKITYITFDLSKEDHHEYYNGFTNRVLWPILHYRIDLAEFSRRDLSGYLRVNNHFARQLHEVLGPNDVVWVHDYHLMPLAKALRERGHKNRIGFFLHIPCPPPEILTALPHHERLIPSLCEYDLVGFQTGDDAFNFSRYLTRECGLHSHDFNFIVADRTVRIDVFPVGIETAAFAHLAQRSVRLPFVKRVISSLAGRALIIGVDRLDYSKGIPQRLSAFELFLQTQPDWRGKVTYLQIAPKSRTEIPEYADMEQVIGSAAGRINGAYGEADWTPIRYINRAYSHTTLAGLYRAARVGLVTPLRDGMNLVAKEYVAAQNPDDPGVLVLSRFAGAAHECKAALLVNPYDPDSVAAAIGQALSMPLAERRERHDSMFRVLSRNDIQHWADRFLTALERAPMALNRLEQMPFVGS